MIPLLYRYVGGALIFFLLLGGVYLKGRSNGADSVQRKFDAYKNTAQLAYDKQKAENDRIQGEWDKLKEQERERKVEFDAAKSNVAGLTRRLRLASASNCPAAGPAFPAGVGEPTGEVPDSVGEVERDADAAWTAAGQDAAALNYCVPAYNSVRDELLKLRDRVE